MARLENSIAEIEKAIRHTLEEVVNLKPGQAKQQVSEFSTFSRV